MLDGRCWLWVVPTRELGRRWAEWAGLNRTEQMVSQGNKSRFAQNIKRTILCLLAAVTIASFSLLNIRMGIAEATLKLLMDQSNYQPAQAVANIYQPRHSQLISKLLRYYRFSTYSNMRFWIYSNLIWRYWLISLCHKSIDLYIVIWLLYVYPFSLPPSPSTFDASCSTKCPPNQPIVLH